MRFFFPDSVDMVDPSFDFTTERRSIDRVRQRDDVYAHEVFSGRVHDGILVSKAVVDGSGGANGRYTLPQRNRLLRVGAHEFFRTPTAGDGRIPILGDCGAFAYVRESTPPYSVDEVLEFYERCGFDLGVSVDHVITAFKPNWDSKEVSTPEANEARRRQELTLELAEEFLRSQRAQSAPFEPLGAAQGWSPRSYAHAVKVLEQMGYSYIALGGLVPLKTKEILATLEAVNEARRPDTRLHLLGITRCDHVGAFARYGAVSFDSTAPLRQAFKDDRDNYYTPTGTYVAVRVPQVEGNPTLQKQIRAGRVSQEQARRLELECLRRLAEFDRGDETVEGVLASLLEYAKVFDDSRDYSEQYRRVLEDRPWRHCPCEVCESIGYHVILFRGAERNRRRGFHNLWVFYRRLQAEIATATRSERVPAQGMLSFASRSQVAAG